MNEVEKELSKIFDIQTCLCGCHFSISNPEGCEHCEPAVIFNPFVDRSLFRSFDVPDLGIKRPLSALLYEQEEGLKREGYMSVLRKSRF